MNFRIPTPIKPKDMKFHQKKQLFRPKLAPHNKLHPPTTISYRFFMAKITH
jgi:hypothetical protein